MFPIKILHLLIINIPGKRKRRIENLFVLVAAKDSLVRVPCKNMNSFTVTPNNLTAISAENYSGKVCFLYTQKVHLLLFIVILAAAPLETLGAFKGGG